MALENLEIEQGYQANGGSVHFNDMTGKGTKIAITGEFAKTADIETIADKFDELLGNGGQLSKLGYVVAGLSQNASIKAWVNPVVVNKSMQSGSLIVARTDKQAMFIKGKLPADKQDLDAFASGFKIAVATLGGADVNGVTVKVTPTKY